MPPRVCSAAPTMEGGPPWSDTANGAVFCSPQLPVQVLRAPQCPGDFWLCPLTLHLPSTTSTETGHGVLPLPLPHLRRGPGGAVQGQLPLLQGPRPQTLVSWEVNWLDQRELSHLAG